MDAKKDDVPPAYHNEGPEVRDEKHLGNVVQEENVHSVALAEAVLAQKPSPWSKSMMKLYFIMGKIYIEHGISTIISKTSQVLVTLFQRSMDTTLLSWALLMPCQLIRKHLT